MSKSQYTISPKGRSLLKYILDVYINETDKTRNPEHEAAINVCYENIVKDKATPAHLREYLLIDDDFRRFLAAEQIYGLIIAEMNEKERTQALNAINSWIMRKYVEDIVTTCIDFA